MSIFDTPDQGNQAQHENQSTGWLDKVVAEKGEQFRDPEQLAKSVFNANMHIRQLEEENAKFKELQLKEQYGKQLLDELRKQQPASGEPAQSELNIAGGTPEATPQNGPEDIKKLVDEAIANREHTRSREQNLAKADEEMRKLFGDQADAELSKRARELGVDKKYLADVAATSPTAFLRMLGEAPKVEPNRNVDSSLNTASLMSNNSGKRNWRYYQDLRKSDPKRYRTSQVQMQMEKDYAELGDSFWN